MELWERELKKRMREQQRLALEDIIRRGWSPTGILAQLAEKRIGEETEKAIEQRRRQLLLEKLLREHHRRQRMEIPTPSPALQALQLLPLLRGTVGETFPIIGKALPFLAKTPMLPLVLATYIFRKPLRRFFRRLREIF